VYDCMVYVHICLCACIVCMRVCVHALCVYVRACTHVYAALYVYIITCVHAYHHECAQIFTCTHAFPCVCMQPVRSHISSPTTHDSAAPHMKQMFTKPQRLLFFVPCVQHTHHAPGSPPSREPYCTPWWSCSSCTRTAAAQATPTLLLLTHLKRLHRGSHGAHHGGAAVHAQEVQQHKTRTPCFSSRT